MKVYPDNETLRDAERASEYRGSSYLEKNCNQIFMKGPALTKEILEKVNAEIVPKKTYLMGYELKTMRVIITTGLCLLFSISLLTAILMWCTNAFDNFVMSQMVLSNNSDSFKMWQKPTVSAVYKVHIFNYTNVKDYKKHYSKKLNVEEVGPYTYEETVERIDISFPTEDTISFRERREVKFRPDLSKGRQHDQLVVPNLVVLSGSAYTKPTNYFNRIAFSALLSGMDEKPFLNIEAEPFITGYTDSLYSIATAFLPYQTPSQMGLMAAKLGESTTVMTMNTGVNDISKLAIIEKVNGKEKFEYFADVCNSIEGTDGALHPPTLVQAKKPLHYVFPQACRRMPLVFNKEINVIDGKVPAYQYIHPENIFDTVEENPENTCFCTTDNNKCSPKGVFEVTACNYGVPMFISHPHFHRGDPSLVKHFNGLHPERDTYQSYFNIHPKMGFVMSAKNIIQLNVQVQKAGSVSQVDMFEDGMILPIAYLEAIVDEKALPQDVIDVIYMVSFTVPSMKLALQYGSLLAAVITLASLLLVIRRNNSPAKKILPQLLMRTGPGYYEAS